MSQNLAREDLLKILQDSLQVFNQLKMKESSKGMKSVLVEARQKPVNNVMLTTTFNSLQSDVRAEFGTNDYRKRLWTNLTSRVVSAMEGHHELVMATADVCHKLMSNK